MICVAITTSANRVLLPPNQFVDTRGHNARAKWSRIPGYDARDSVIVLSVFSNPYWVSKGQELRLWYGEDLGNQGTWDNSGTTCCNVYLQYA